MNELITISLEWTPIKHYREFVTLKNVCAIYIWGFGGPSSFKPYYVGKSENLKERFFMHLFTLIGGAYKIYDSKELFTLDKNNVKYFPNSDNILDFIDNYETYKPHLQNMLDNFYFTYAIVNDKKYLADLEKSVIKEIGKANLGNYRGGEPTIYNHQNCGDRLVIESLLKYLENEKLV
jgi:hypothetical protein